jgi:hypothetical protein
VYTPALAMYHPFKLLAVSLPGSWAAGRAIQAATAAAASDGICLVIRKLLRRKR